MPSMTVSPGADPPLARFTKSFNNDIVNIFILATSWLHGLLQYCLSCLELGLGGPNCNEEVDGLGVKREVDLHTATGVSQTEGSTSTSTILLTKKFIKYHNNTVIVNTCQFVYFQEFLLPPPPLVSCMGSQLSPPKFE